MHGETLKHTHMFENYFKWNCCFKVGVNSVVYGTALSSCVVPFCKGTVAV